jgi:hypothetical protein
MHKQPLRVAGFLALLAVTLPLAQRAGMAAVLPLSADQMVRLSRQIVVASVEGRQVRWNEQHTLIVTDYFLRIESHLRGETEERVKLTMPGGTLDGETHDTSISVRLRQGSRYLLFCHDLAQPQMMPITGAWQGVFREVLKNDGASSVASGEGSTELMVSGKAVSFPAFVETVRELAQKAPAYSEDHAIGWTAKGKDLPAKVYPPVA